MKIEIIQGPWTKADAETVISMRMALSLRMQYSSSNPKKPKDHKPLNEFWRRLGYVENSNLFLNIAYQEIGDETKTSHSFFYSLKSLLPGKDLK